MPPPADKQLANSQRILVRGVNWLGDAVMSTPALSRIKEAHPNSALTLLTPEKLADLWIDHPAIDSVLTFQSRESVFSISARLRAQPFDVGLILPNSFRSAFEVWWGRVPNRIGYSGQLRRMLLTCPVVNRSGAIVMRKRSRHEVWRLNRGDTGMSERCRNPHLAHPVPAQTMNAGGSVTHHIHQYLHLASHLGANSAPVAPQLFLNRAEVDAFRLRFGLCDRAGLPWFGLNPGAEYGPAKRWPAESFIAAAQQIQQHTHCRWLIFGGKGDMDLASRIAAEIGPGTSKEEPRVINLAGSTSLRELCAGLKLCEVLLTNDTGPMHLAAALGTRIIGLFGSTSPELTGPGMPGDHRHVLLKSSVPCAPCFRRECPIDLKCMREIEIAEVVRAALGSWNLHGTQGGR